MYIAGFRFVQEKAIDLCVEWILNEYRNNRALETSLKSRHQIQKLFDLKYINQLFINLQNEVINCNSNIIKIILLIINLYT